MSAVDFLARVERARVALGAVFMDEVSPPEDRIDALELIASDIEMYLGKLESHEDAVTHEAEEEGGDGDEAE